MITNPPTLLFIRQHIRINGLKIPAFQKEHGYFFLTCKSQKCAKKAPSLHFVPVSPESWKQAVQLWGKLRFPI